MSLKSQMNGLRSSGLYDPPSLSTYPISIHTTFASGPSYAISTRFWAVSLLAAACLAGYLLGEGSTGQEVGYGACVLKEARPGMADDYARAKSRAPAFHRGLGTPIDHPGTSVW